MTTYHEEYAPERNFDGAQIHTDELSLEWRGWLVQSRLAGVPDDQLQATIMSNGYSSYALTSAYEALSQEGSFVAAQQATQRWKKLKSILNIRKSLASLAYGSGQIERRSSVSRSEFLERYYAANKPVIFTDLLCNSFAYQYWTPDYLSQSCGDVTVEVMAGRHADPRYEMNSDTHRSSMRLADYVDMVLQGGSTNDYYLVANNGFFTRAETQTLYHESPQLPEYLDHSEAQQKTFLWFGPAGTITPLHHDIMNIMVAQVYGRKRFTLLCPEDTPHVYNEVGVYGDVDCKNPDYTRHPLYECAAPIEVTLDPGDVLFIPVGWWHHVEALETSIMVSYTNFWFPNEYRWENP
jgi:hypothetical protein